ncbi:MAG: hypothetical protein VB081_00995 [Christensenella sp.]|uniref:hypothetical protein n=1 Tax=Christensenella sp. TaxID=1935934 RepID=UPI002B1EEFF8|nr:hypothetical protein [Christensenella sp.]MEA5002067.1 hypothetical protein [Christensenella sp.]
MMQLLGMPLDQVSKMLEKEAIPYKVVCYRSYKPYEDADCARVIRVRETDGVYELVVGEFKTEIDERSQG